MANHIEPLRGSVCFIRVFIFHMFHIWLFTLYHFVVL